MRRRLVHYLEYVTTDQWRIPVGCVMFEVYINSSQHNTHLFVFTETLD